MRDLIWTLILVWVVYRLFTAFRLTSRKTENRASSENAGTGTENAGYKDDASKRTALRRHLNKEGEYVDFEEIHDRRQ
jgi:hypothetical protein